jgi:hypothetical protein
MLRVHHFKRFRDDESDDFYPASTTKEHENSNKNLSKALQVYQGAMSIGRSLSFLFVFDASCNGLFNPSLIHIFPLKISCNKQYAEELVS